MLCVVGVLLHWCLGLCLDHGTALGSLGNGAFLGALAIPGLLDVKVFVVGADLTGMAGDALGAEDGAGA